MGQVHGAMAALPHLREAGGSLVCVSSMGAKRGIPLQTAYCASKHGLDGFLESLRSELQHDRVPVSVTNVMPATINTPLFDNARTKLGVKPVARPPVYQPRIVVDAILHAAEHPVRDVVVGGAARVVILTEALAPRVLDTVLRLTGTACTSPTTPRTRQRRTTCSPRFLSTTRSRAPSGTTPCRTASTPGSGCRRRCALSELSSVWLPRPRVPRGPADRQPGAAEHTEEPSWHQSPWSSGRSPH